KEINGVAARLAISELKSKHLIGNDLYAYRQAAVSYHGLPVKQTGVASIPAENESGHFCRFDIMHEFGFSACLLNSHYDVRHHEGVFHGIACLRLVIGEPLQPARVKRQDPFQKIRPEVSQAVDHWFGTAPGGSLALEAGPFQIAVMVEQLKPAERSLRTALDYRNEMRRADIPVFVDMEENFQV